MINGYNFDGNGYIVIPDSLPEGTSGRFINQVIFSTYGFIPKFINGSNTTYFTDSFHFDNKVVGYVFGGNATIGTSGVGSFSTSLVAGVSSRGWEQELPFRLEENK